MLGSERAHALHRSFPPIDLHVDSLLWARSVGYDLRDRHDHQLPFAAFGLHVDIPRAVEGGLGTLYLGLVSIPHFHTCPGDVVDDQISLLDSLVSSDSRVRKVQKAGDNDLCFQNQKLGLALGIEGAHALGGSLDRLRAFAARGVRYLGLVHFSANEAACPAFGLGSDSTQGLTSFGRRVVEACEALGVRVDLAHINRRGFLDVCKIARRPVIVSHTGVMGASPHWRNIDDDQLRAVAALGGVVGILFSPNFLGGRGIDAVAKHLLHVVKVAGEDTPAIGSDWDGMIIPTPDLRDAAHLPLLTDALLEAGASETQVAKILRNNALRVLDG